MTNPRKILVVIARLNVGGTSKYIQNLVQHSDNKKFNFLIATGFVQGQEIEDNLATNLQIVRIKHLGRKISIWRDFQARREILKVVKAYRPDLIYTHTFKAGLLVRSMRLDIPLIHNFHGHLLNEPEFKGIKRKIIILLERRLARRNSAIVTVGERVGIELKQYRIGLGKTFISIPPGIEMPILRERDAAFKELGIKSEYKTIVSWVARTVPVKRPERVVKLANLFPDTLFLVAGGGSLFNSIKSSAPKNLKAIGWIDSSLIWSITDIGISTSENEGMPIALIEAHMMGVPIVAIDVGAVGEVVIDGKTGFVVKHFDQDFVNRLEMLISDKRLRYEFGINAKSFAINEFSTNKLVSKHEMLFQVQHSNK